MSNAATQATADSIWSECRALFRRHANLLSAVAGVFVFLPTLAVAMFVPAPEMNAMGANFIDNLLEYYEANLAVLLIAQIPILLGSAAMLVLMVGESRPSVGQALAAAGRLLLVFVVLNLMVRVATSFGMVLFVLPGLYFAARAILAEPVMMAESVANPIAALARSFALTRNYAWQLMLLTILFAVIIFVATTVASMLIGIVGALALPEGGVRTLSQILAALQGTMMTLGFVILSAASYRQLKA